MVLNLCRIYQTPDKDLNIVVRNHNDQKAAFCCPGYANYVEFSRWLFPGMGFTELNVTNAEGRVACIQLEDDNDWGLVISGSIEGGRKRVTVGGTRDFDVTFTADGHIRLECRDGQHWGPETEAVVELVLVPFKK